MKRFTWVTVLAAWVAGLGLMLGVAAQTHAATVYSAANDFSLLSNPNGVWSYGYENSLGLTLVLYDVATMDARATLGLDSWTSSSLGVDPHIIHNRTSSPLNIAGSVTVPANGLQFHPGPADEFSVIRWTAPAGGAYTLDVAFRGNDFVGPTSTDVHVLHNTTSLFTGNVSAYGPGPSFTTVVTVFCGDTIDFLVGVGPNGTHFFDSTGIEATITFGGDGEVCRRTMGFWKNHEDATTAFLPKTLGTYVVDTFLKAKAVFDSADAKNALDMLAGQLLAAKLNVMNGEPHTCIDSVISDADSILVTQGYGGPGIGTPLTKSAKATAIADKDALDNFNNEGC